jgi:hypothetical protein
VLTIPLFGLKAGVGGTIAFLNVAFLAPFISVWVINYQRLRVLLTILFFNIFLGSIFYFIQTLGYDLSMFFGHYAGGRGGLNRYITNIGDPNAAGICGVILFYGVIAVIKNKVLKNIAIIAAIFLVVYSLSKAAYGAFLIAALLMLLFNWKYFVQVSKRPLQLKKIVFWGSIFALIVLLLAVFFHNVIVFFLHYFCVGLRAFTGNSAQEHYGLLQDAHDRVLGNLILGVSFAQQKLGAFWGWSLLVGGTYGIAGYGNTAFSPHNAILEVFLLGGGILLFIFLFLMWLKCKHFYRIYKTHQYPPEALFFLIMFVLLSINLFFYPMYHPFLGALFWCVVAYRGGYEVLSDQQQKL